MLTLARKAGEKIRIGPDIVLTVCRVGRGGKVHIGIDAPPEVAIVRDDARSHAPRTGKEGRRGTVA